VVRQRKLLQRVRNNPRDVRFSDLLELVAAVGFVPIRQRPGSHRRFVHPTAQEYLNLQPGNDGKAKPYQVKEFLEKVDRLGLRLPEEEGEP